MQFAKKLIEKEMEMGKGRDYKQAQNRAPGSGEPRIIAKEHGNYQGRRGPQEKVTLSRGYNENKANQPILRGLKQNDNTLTPVLLFERVKGREKKSARTSKEKIRANRGGGTFFRFSQCI